MKTFTQKLLVVLFALSSINIAMASDMASDDNYHGNDVAGAQTNPTITSNLNSHTFRDSYLGNDVDRMKTNPTIVTGLDSHTFDNDEYEGNN